MGDATQLMQLFQNLIGNAIKFKSEAPLTVNIEAKRQGDKWIFSVSDNGIGIKEDYFERIQNFLTFTLGDDVNKRFKVIIDDPEYVAKYMRQQMEVIRAFRRKNKISSAHKRF